MILEETEQMSDLVEELLALSRLESGQANAVFHSMDVREVLYDCLRSTERPAMQRKLRITPCFDEDPVLVNCDEDQLRRAFTNIITNLHCGMQKGKIQIECKADRGKAIVRIHDDGEGIAPELCRTFSTAFQHPQGGAGIGLSLAKEIVSSTKAQYPRQTTAAHVFENQPSPEKTT